MLAIVGLGNPGDKYARSRHNAGWDVIEILSQKLSIPVKKLKCRATVGEGTLAGQKIVLVKPQTFMNASGLCVADAMRWYKLAPEEILVIADDIDLPFGQVRLRPHGGAGTHNGMKSIIECLNTEGFPRVRVGMGAPPPEWDLADFVLSKYPDEAARKTAFDAYLTAADAAICWAEKGIDMAMNRFNKKHMSAPKDGSAEKSE